MVQTSHPPPPAPRIATRHLCAWCACRHVCRSDPYRSEIARGWVIEAIQIMPTPKKIASATASGAAMADAARRRLALRRLMNRHQIRPAELARRLGMPSPNALYNFLNGHSDSLSQRYLERILAAFPDATEDGLVQNKPEPTRNPANQAATLVYRQVPVAMLAQAGLLQDTTMRPEAERFNLAVPDTLVGKGRKLIAVLVRLPGAELAFPDGSLLVCEEVPNHRRHFEPAEHVVVQEDYDEGVEITIRRIHRHGGDTWLWPCSSHPSHQYPLRAPWDLSVQAESGPKVHILARVIASWQRHGAVHLD
jgi:transcriptional regulator with XRE-family HTH domain